MSRPLKVCITGNVNGDTFIPTSVKVNEEKDDIVIDDGDVKNLSTNNDFITQINGNPKIINNDTASNGNINVNDGTNANDNGTNVNANANANDNGTNANANDNGTNVNANANDNGTNVNANGSNVNDESLNKTIDIQLTADNLPMLEDGQTFTEKDKEALRTITLQNPNFTTDILNNIMNRIYTNKKDGSKTFRFANLNDKNKLIIKKWFVNKWNDQNPLKQVILKEDGSIDPIIKTGTGGKRRNKTNKRSTGGKRKTSKRNKRRSSKRQ